MENYFFIKGGCMNNLKTKPFTVIDSPDDEIFTTIMKHNKEHDYFIAHDIQYPQIFKYVADKKYKYLLANVFENDDRGIISYSYYLFSNKEQYDFAKSMFVDCIEYGNINYDKSILRESGKIALYIDLPIIKRIIINDISIIDIRNIDVDYHTISSVGRLFEHNKKIIAIIEDKSFYLYIYKNNYPMSYSVNFINTFIPEDRDYVYIHEEQPLIKIAQRD